MNLTNFFQSQKFKIIVGVFIIIIVLLFIFQLGMMVGFRKADFSFRWSENYHRNFGGPRGGIFGNFEGRDFIDAHGIFGQIIKIDGSELVIRSRDNVEKVLLIKDDTIIKRFQDTIKVTDLKVDDYITTIGEPNNSGQIEAKFIRIMPALPENAPRGFLPQRGI